MGGYGMFRNFRFPNFLTTGGFCGTLLFPSMMPSILIHTAVLLSVGMIAANGLCNSNLLRRLPMRFPAGKVVATYSYTDDQVRFISRTFLLLGCLMGGMVVGVIMQAYN